MPSNSIYVDTRKEIYTELDENEILDEVKDTYEI